MGGFARLRAELAECHDFSTFSAQSLLAPFLEVVRSQATTGVITLISLNAIGKFFALSVINEQSVDLKLALQELAAAITHCRFQATDQNEDDAVLLKILSLMEEVVCKEHGGLLTDSSVCEIVETCLSMACQMRRGDVLRRAAEMTMIKLSHSVFVRLQTMEPEPDEDFIDESGKVQMSQETSNSGGIEDIGSKITVSGGEFDTQDKPASKPNQPHTEEETPSGDRNRTEEDTSGDQDKDIDQNSSKEDRKSGEQGTADDSLKNNENAPSGENTSSDENSTMPSKGNALNNSISQNDNDQYKEEEDGEYDPKPYGIASIREVFRVLISILDPANFHQYTDSTRIMALRLINVAFEVSEKDISNHKSLLNLTTTQLCKHLFQLIRHDNPQLLQSALQVILTLLHSPVRHHLKMQQEFFFTYILTTLTPMVDIPREPDVDNIFYEGVPNQPKLVKSSVHPVRTQTSTPVAGRSGTPQSAGVTSGATSAAASGGLSTPLSSHKSPDSREVMVEAITSLARIPSFFTDLFINYDCDVDRTDLCEDLIGFLCRNAYPDTAQWSTASVPPLCLEAVLALLGSMIGNISHRNGKSTPGSEKDNDLVQKLIDKKAQKKQAIIVAEAFNEKPKAGLSMLVDRGITKDDTPASIAKWLRQSGRLNKQALGEYLSKTDNKEVMHLFIEDFDFTDMRLDEALRDFLSAFRLPGESQLIEKIFEKFASQYCKFEGSSQQEIANEDAAFVLSYAIILLNTDQHNAQNKRPMTVDDFKRNLRGANDGKDFSPEYLEDMYKTIKSREIIMPDEHDNDETFEYAWKSLLLRTSQAGKFMDTGEIVSAASSKGSFDKHVFQTVWKPVVTTLAFVFATATDDTVFSRVITGFDQVARLAAQYQVAGVMDHIVECLSRMSTLGAGDQAAPTNNTEIQIEGEGGNKITVSDLSIPFGSDFKAQMASVILFRIVRSHASEINQSWDHILPALANLYLYGLAKPPYSEELHIKYGIESLPMIKPSMTIKRNKGGRDVGLFSAISNYLSGTDHAQEPSDEDLDATLSSIDCIKSCNLPDLFRIIRDLDGASLAIFISWVIANMPKLVDHKQVYYPVSLYYLEMATVLSHKDEDSVVKVWSTLNTYLKNWQSFDPSFLMRILNYSLIVIMSSGDSSQEHGNDQKDALEHELATTLNNILGINPKLLSDHSPVILQTVLKLLDSSCYAFVIESPEYWALLGHLSESPEANEHVYKAIQALDKSAISSANFEPIIKVVGSIARSCSDKEKGMMVLETINMMGTTSLEAEDWKRQWYPFVSVLSMLCYHPVRPIREASLKHFQRILLSPDLHNHEEFEWLETFDKALFPLIESLLKPEVFETDPEGMPVTRLQVATLLCKLFLQYAVQTQCDEKVLGLWVKILETLDRLVNSGQRDSLRESVVESLKNVLLVVSSTEFAADDKFWSETWKRIDSFLPGLREQVFPPGEKEKEQSDKKSEEDKEKEESATTDKEQEGSK